MSTLESMLGVLAAVATIVSVSASIWAARLKKSMQSERAALEERWRNEQRTHDAELEEIRLEHRQELARAQANLDAELARKQQEFAERLSIIRELQDATSQALAHLTDFRAVVDSASAIKNSDMLYRIRGAIASLLAFQAITRSFLGKIKVRHSRELELYVDLLTLVLLDMTADQQRRSLPDFVDKMQGHSELVSRITERILWLLECYRSLRPRAGQGSQLKLAAEVREMLSARAVEPSRPERNGASGQSVMITWKALSIGTNGHTSAPISESPRIS